jgi:hypothetical protein
VESVLKIKISIHYKNGWANEARHIASRDLVDTATVRVSRSGVASDYCFFSSQLAGRKPSTGVAFSDASDGIRLLGVSFFVTSLVPVKSAIFSPQNFIPEVPIFRTTSRPAHSRLARADIG